MKRDTEVEVEDLLDNEEEEQLDNEETLESRWDRSRWANITIQDEDDLRMKFMEYLYEKKVALALSSALLQDRERRQLLYNKRLFSFVQGTPDTMLLFYRPVVAIGQAQMELEMILITPTEIWCITRVEGTSQSVFTQHDQRYWAEVVGKQKELKVNPVTALLRTSKVVTGIVQELGVDLPVRKVIVSEDSYMDIAYIPYGIDLIDRRSYGNWMESLRSERTAIKFQQLKVADRLFRLADKSEIEED
ncbi:MAG: hypothetical protein ACRC5C_03560 [Bacilli bacterium]